MALAIAVAAGNVILYGLLGRFLAGRIGSASQARYAGLFLAIGFAIGSFGGHAGSEPETFLALRGTGYLLGIAVFAASLLHPRVQRLQRER
ncbi:hypothetical protein M9979_09870 [Sphingomonas sp. RP10(2022)]|uniref:Uncharacterized protein n=1 Tax=Sphingomonas liriopis TaxID=2949094 RepID=A0A9X2KQN7_9SPHN|nr:hypothetical protein [Sphingomonas liriopis]MCP3735175.1 hypothetical protein [Sphingomonas liriopis]